MSHGQSIDDQDQLSTPPAEDTAGAQVSAIGRKAGRGLRWALFCTVLLKLGTFALGLVLVRLIAPHDFGVYAVALAANAFVMHVNDMGIIAATVQWRGKVEEMAATGATLALGFSIAWYALFWFAAPELAQLAGTPEATPVVRLLTATILIDGITAVRVGLIQRGFQQDKLTLAFLIAFVANAATAITLAVNGAGAYSFAFGAIAGSVVGGVIVLGIARLPFRYGFDREVARRLLKFGVPLAAALGVESLLLFSDTVIVGHILGPTLLGFYLLAFNVSSWVPGLVGTAVRYVSIPSFSRLAEQKPEALALGVRGAIPLMFTVVMPIAMTMAVLAPALIEFLYGARWLPAAEALQFLAVVMIARMLTGLAFDILTSLGTTHVMVWLNLAWAAVLIPCLIVGIHLLGGIHGAAIAHAIVALVVAIPLGIVALQRGGVNLRPVVPAVVRSLLAGVLAGLIMLGVSKLFDFPPPLELFVAGGTGLIAYLLVGIPANQIARFVGRAPHFLKREEAQA
jgi:O-antigen/teichoic acid export membrane protein